MFDTWIWTSLFVCSLAGLLPRSVWLSGGAMLGLASAHAGRRTRTLTALLCALLLLGLLPGLWQLQHLPLRTQELLSLNLALAMLDLLLGLALARAALGLKHMTSSLRTTSA